MTTTPASSLSDLDAGVIQNDVEALLTLRLNGIELFMPGFSTEDRLRWAVPMAKLMRVKPAYSPATNASSESST